MVEENSLYGLTYGCPHLERQDDCPYTQVEHLSFSEKVKWVDRLSNEEKEAILEYHKVCPKNRYSIGNLVCPFARMARGFFIWPVQQNLHQIGVWRYKPTRFSRNSRGEGRLEYLNINLLFFILINYYE